MAQRKAEPPASVASGLVPPAAYRTKSDIARLHIQQLIRSGSAQPGDHITTREISEALGMSETPVREAVRSLAAEGWLDFNPHLGVAVSSVKADQLAEIYALRGALGAVAIELGAALLGPARIAALECNLSAAAAAVAARDAARYAELNQEFHVLLSDTPATQWTLRLLNSLWAQTATIGRGFELVPRRMADSLAEHRAILAAVAAGQHCDAASLLVAHERQGGTVLIAALSAAAHPGGA
jgi:DNA-binding GntR family transcriptional regulator